MLLIHDLCAKGLQQIRIQLIICLNIKGPWVPEGRMTLIYLQRQ